VDVTVCIPTLESKNKIQLFLEQISLDNPNITIMISNVKPLTKYFIFLDDDIIYKKGLIKLLYDSIIKIKSLKIGAVQGSTQPIGFGKKWDSALENTIEVVQKVSFGKRFMTSNAIIKTDAVKDWKPDASVSGCEDWHLTNYLLNLGYCIFIIPANVKHKTSFSKIRLNARWFARGFIHVFDRGETIKYILKLLLGIMKALVFIPDNWRKSLFILYQNSFVVKNLVIGFLTNI
jgi:hypothetical protein